MQFRGNVGADDVFDLDPSVLYSAILLEVGSQWLHVKKVVVGRGCLAQVRCAVKQSVGESVTYFDVLCYFSPLLLHYRAILALYHAESRYR